MLNVGDKTEIILLMQNQNNFPKRGKKGHIFLHIACAENMRQIIVQ